MTDGLKPSPEAVERLRVALEDAARFESASCMVNCADLRAALRPATMPGDVAQIVAWLREDATLTEHEARRIVANTTGNARKNAAEWQMLVDLKRGLADAIERGDFRRTVTGQGEGR